MLQEINQRSNNGLTVALLWDDSDGATFIECETDSEWFRFRVASEAASDAFSHPFVYEHLSKCEGYPYAQHVASEMKS